METFKINNLIEYAETQYPDRMWIVESLKQSSIFKKESEAYYYCIPKDNWDFKHNIVLDDTVYGDVVLDIMKDNTIGGVELVSRIQY